MCSPAHFVCGKLFYMEEIVVTDFIIIQYRSFEYKCHIEVMMLGYMYVCVIYCCWVYNIYIAWYFLYAPGSHRVWKTGKKIMVGGEKSRNFILGQKLGNFFILGQKS